MFLLFSRFHKKLHGEKLNLTYMIVGWHSVDNILGSVWTPFFESDLHPWNQGPSADWPHQHFWLFDLGDLTMHHLFQSYHVLHTLEWLKLKRKIEFEQALPSPFFWLLSRESRFVLFFLLSIKSVSKNFRFLTTSHEEGWDDERSSSILASRKN